MGEPTEHSVGFVALVSADGSLSVPASVLAAHGVHPGSRVRLVPVPPESVGGRHAGILNGTVPPAAVDELIAGLDEAKTERAAHYGGPTPTE
jgi:hypothetical protein